MKSNSNELPISVPLSFFILAEATQMGKSFSKLEKFVEKGL